MPAKLLYRDAQGRDSSVDVPEPTPVFLGRAADCIIRTDDAMVSRKNCKISFAGGKFLVEDLGSSNGTFVNERKVQKQALNHGDVIRCGSLQVRYVEVAGGAGQQPSGGNSMIAQTPAGVGPMPSNTNRPRTQAVEAVVMPPGAMSQSLLGMSFLRRLAAVEFGKGRLVLRQ